MMTKERTEIAHTVKIARRTRRPMYASMMGRVTSMTKPRVEARPGFAGARLSAGGFGGPCRGPPCHQFFQKKVAGREMPGVLPSGLLYWRDGMLPMLFFTTPTPMEAG